MSRSSLVLIVLLGLLILSKLSPTIYSKETVKRCRDAYHHHLHGPVTPYNTPGKIAPEPEFLRKCKEMGL